MIFIFVFLFTWAVSNVFFSFDEETLIILASILWVDAAGGLFKSMLDAELVHKVDVLKVKFLWFLKLKQDLLQDILVFHRTRTDLGPVFLKFRNSFLSNAVTTALAVYADNAFAREVYDAREGLFSFGDATQYDKIVRGLKETISGLDYASVEIRTDGSDDALVFDAYPLSLNLHV